MFKKITIMNGMFYNQPWIKGICTNCSIFIFQWYVSIRRYWIHPIFIIHNIHAYTIKFMKRAKCLVTYQAIKHENRTQKTLSSYLSTSFAWSLPQWLKLFFRSILLWNIYRYKIQDDNLCFISTYVDALP